jgi:WD40 repeat protein
MVTGSSSKMVQLWDMKKAVVLKELEGHDGEVSALAVSQDGQLIASGDRNGEVIAWDANIGVSLSKTIPAHVYKGVTSLDFCPDGSMLATAGANGQIKLFSTKTWDSESENLHDLRSFRSGFICVRYSPSGELLAIATSENIQIYNTRTRTRVIKFDAHSRDNVSLAWMPDGTRLFSAGGRVDPSIREWDPSTWKQVGGPWNGHLKPIDSISLNSSGTLLASASQDKRVRLWRLSESDQRTIDSEFKHELPVSCVTFSADDRHILSSSGRTISEWPLFNNAITEDDPKDFLVEQVTDQVILFHLCALSSSKHLSYAKAHAHSDFEACSYLWHL